MNNPPDGWINFLLPDSSGDLWTALAAVATFVYVALTYQLFRATSASVDEHRRAIETELMQRLMTRYDALFADNDRLQRFWNAWGIATPGSFITALEDTENPEHGQAKAMNESRHNVSRFFVSIRRLAQAGYLPEDVIVASVDGRIIRWFLERVDPLDEAKAGKNYSPDDRQYFVSLLTRRYAGRT